ncbi:MAG: hypothetical protein WC682_00310 [Parcubacteria group bacterium]|jgi:transposase-like protein
MVAKLIVTLPIKDLGKINVQDSPSEKNWKFIELNKCPQCNSANFERLFGGRFNKKCTKCNKAFEENSTLLKYLST